MNPSNSRPINILLIDDNPADVRLTSELLKRTKMINNLVIVEDGEEALSYVYRQNGYEDAKRPDLILLDINLPKISGFEVLQQIKTDPQLRKIPVVVLTASKAERDIMESYNLSANAYISKPLDLNQFADVVKAIDDFWLAIVTFPHV